MSDQTGIEWADATWNPIVGCSVVSPGCTNCYAMKMAGRIENMNIGRHAPHASRREDIPPSAYDGLTQDSKTGAIWNGKVAQASEETLTKPLRWKRPRRIFVNSMGDLFHDNVPDAWIDRVFAVMALAPQHVFQVLTKRSGRMREYCGDENTPFRIAQAIDAMQGADGGPEEVRPISGYTGYFASSLGVIYTEHRGPRRALKPDVGEQGHSRVQLHREGAGRYGDRLLVHRIILETFVGPASTPETQGRHFDRNPQNNTARNLQWGDQPSNWQDSKRHGTHRRYSKLTQSDANTIRQRHADGDTGEALAREFGVSATQIRNIASGRQWNVEPPISWPLANCWLGVSAEDLIRADERIPDLLATPAAVRFVSAEPLLAAIDFGSARGLPVYWEGNGTITLTSFGRTIGARPGQGWMKHSGNMQPWLDWILVGGESGPGARPMHPDWARAIRDQCAAAGTPFFFKQWGEWIDADEWLAVVKRGGAIAVSGIDPNRSHPLTFEEATRLAENAGWRFEHQSDGTTLIRVGTRRAGRWLDGVEHSAFPASKHPSGVGGDQPSKPQTAVKLETLVK